MRKHEMGGTQSGEPFLWIFLLQKGATNFRGRTE